MRLPGVVNGHDRHAVPARFERDDFFFGALDDRRLHWSLPWTLRKAHDAASTTTAAPRPPAAEAVARPRPPPRRRSSCRTVLTMRAPVAASGWPMAIEPPWMLKRSMSTSPIDSLRPSCSAENFFDANIFKLHRT